MNIETKDEVVLAVLKKMDQRSIIGQQKYGATMMEEIVGQKKDLNRFLIDVQEELMDALLYIEAAKRCLTDEIEDAMINRINVIGQNGNTGKHYEDEFVSNMSPQEISRHVKMSEKDIEVIAEEIKSPGNPAKALVDATEEYKEILK